LPKDSDQAQLIKIYLSLGDVIFGASRERNTDEERIIRDFVRSKSVPLMDLKKETFHVYTINTNLYVCKGKSFSSLDDVVKFIKTSYRCVDYHIEIQIADEHTKAFWESVNRERRTKTTKRNEYETCMSVMW